VRQECERILRLTLNLRRFTPSKLSLVVQKPRERKWLLCRHIWCYRLQFVLSRSFYVLMEIFSKLFQMYRIKKQGEKRYLIFMDVCLWFPKQKKSIKFQRICCPWGTFHLYKHFLRRTFEKKQHGKHGPMIECRFGYFGKRDCKEFGCLKIMFTNKVLVPSLSQRKRYFDAHFSFHRVLHLTSRPVYLQFQTTFCPFHHQFHLWAVSILFDTW